MEQRRIRGWVQEHCCIRYVARGDAENGPCCNLSGTDIGSWCLVVRVVNERVVAGIDREFVRSRMAENAVRATEETAASEDLVGAAAPTCVVQDVEPLGAPIDAALNAARSGWSVSDSIC